ncbi:acyl-CoA carboxylase subunit beta [Faecalispora jeddahensis]|uniref:acyl-CoA carboxylase subunit beta n=1 Tax=Faecalispora jeddahensis TaxID=1414721 RepID=UPI00189960A2|nr:acyl-CoA carboxylase subunit beta [Faecalispora jeddahensis]
MENTTKIQEMLGKKAKIMQGGGPQRVQKQHAAGKLTARERLDLLFDPGTFQEYNIFMKHRCHDFGMEKVDAPAEGVVTGYGLVNGRGVFAFAHDFTVLGGAMGEMQGMKVKRIQELALDAGVPFVGLNDSGGGRIQEGPATSYGAIFYNNVMASGVIPQISAVMGPCAGGTVYSPALTDFVFSVDKTSRSFLTGPSVIKNVTGETVDEETLGGARTHNTLSGVSHYFCENDVDCIEQIKVLLSYLPPNYREPPPAYPCTDAPDRRCEMLNTFIPDNERKTYNIKDIILEIADSHDFFERQAMYATNIVTGFIRMNGKSVGVVANQPQSLAGCIDINASDKAARFIRTCDCFNIPLLSIVSVPGFLPGIDQEFGGIIRHGAKMLYAWSEATVPKIVMAVGKVVGGARPAMCSWELHPDIIFAWPSAQMIVVGAESAVDICRKKELKAAREAGEDVDALRRQYIEEYTREFVNPYKAAEFGKFEDIIEPAQSRHIIIRALEMFRNKKVVLPVRKHGNIPL